MEMSSIQNTVNINGGNGFDIGSSSNNSFVENTVNDNSQNAFFLLGSDQNAFFSNTAMRNESLDFTEQDSMGTLLCNNAFGRQ
jgi:parallel beta-helix repeat protein